MSAVAESIELELTPTLRYLLRWADTALIHAQRLAEWCGHGPVLEEDIALTNLALDLIGQSRALLTHAAALEGQGFDEDQLAFLRDEGQFLNLTLAEQPLRKASAHAPGGDFADTVVRNFLLATWFKLGWSGLLGSSDAELAAIAGKAVKEARYHQQHAADWVLRLGDGTDESHRRVQAAVDYLLPFTAEFWAASALDAQAAQAGVDVPALRADWDRAVDAVLQEATLARPPAVDGYVPQGKQGVHSEHLSYLLGEMQSLARAHQGAVW